MQSLGRLAEPRGELVAVTEHGLGEKATAGVETVDKVVASFSEIPRQGFAGHDEARRRRFGVQLDRFRGLSAAVLDFLIHVRDASDDLVRASGAGLGELRRDFAA